MKLRDDTYLVESNFNKRCIFLRTHKICDILLEQPMGAAGVKTGSEEAAAGSRFLQSRQYPIHHQQHQAARSGVVGKGCQGQYRSERYMDYNNTSKWTAANGGGSGMRAVFLGSGGSGRESSGTGVFLPRCAGNGPELKRKPGKFFDSEQKTFSQEPPFFMSWVYE